MFAGIMLLKQHITWLLQEWQQNNVLDEHVAVQCCLHKPYKQSRFVGWNCITRGLAYALWMNTFWSCCSLDMQMTVICKKAEFESWQCQNTSNIQYNFLK